MSRLPICDLRPLQETCKLIKNFHFTDNINNKIIRKYFIIYICSGKHSTMESPVRSSLNGRNLMILMYKLRESRSILMIMELIALNASSDSLCQGKNIDQFTRIYGVHDLQTYLTGKGAVPSEFCKVKNSQPLIIRSTGRRTIKGFNKLMQLTTRHEMSGIS